MTRFTLLVLPDGRALLTTKELLGREFMEQLVEQWKLWREGIYTIGILPECEIVQVADIEIDLAKKTLTAPISVSSHGNAIAGVTE